MNAVEIVGLIASVVSLVLALGAIWLSVMFFRMSNEASKATTEAAKGIDASVKRLENLFDKLYSDTFSMMKDTVSDMRKHIWSGGDSSEADEKDKILEEADKKAEEKVAEVRKAMDRQLSEILARQRVSEGNVTAIKSEMERLLDNAIQTSRQIESEAREETLRNHILLEIRKIRRKGRIAIAEDIVKSLGDNIPPPRVVTEMERMRDDGVVMYEGRYLRPETEIRLPTVSERSARDG